MTSGGKVLAFPLESEKWVRSRKSINMEHIKQTNSVKVDCVAIHHIIDPLCLYGHYFVIVLCQYSPSHQMILVHKQQNQSRLKLADIFLKSPFCSSPGSIFNLTFLEWINIKVSPHVSLKNVLPLESVCLNAKHSFSLNGLNYNRTFSYKMNPTDNWQQCFPEITKNMFQNTGIYMSYNLTKTNSL